MIVSPRVMRHCAECDVTWQIESECWSCKRRAYTMLEINFKSPQHAYYSHQPTEYTYDRYDKVLRCSPA